MKRTVWVMGLLMLALLVAACSSGGGANVPELTLGSAPWQDGEKIIYDIVDQKDNKLGTSEFTFAQDGNAWVLSASDRIDGPDPAKPAIEQIAKVRIDATTLKPLGKEKTIQRSGTDAKLNITYTGGKLEIKATVNGKNQHVAIDVPASAIENDQLLMTLRALPFAEGYEARFVNVVPDNAAKINTTVRVKGKEQVDTPAGSVEAWRVELDFGQAKQTAWYQVAAPNQMVQYDNGASKLVLSK